MGPKTTPSLIFKGGYQIPPPLGGRKIDTPSEIGVMINFSQNQYQTSLAEHGNGIFCHQKLEKQVFLPKLGEQ